MTPLASSTQQSTSGWLSWLHPWKGQTSPSPSDSQPTRALEGRQFTFNHVDSFAIKAQQLFFQIHCDPTGKWHPIPCPVIPEEVDADGANLMVRSKDTIYYKKVLLEYRQPKTNAYQYLDISGENNWYKGWFQLIKDFLHIPIEGTNLKLPVPWRDWSCSHRGLFCDAIQDGIGQTHLHPLSVTSADVLTGDGSAILVFDPYVEQKVRVWIPMPHTLTTTFEGLKLSSSASTKMVVGYETKRNPDGPGVIRTLKVLTILDDNDTLGSDPLISYAYPNNAEPTKFVIPMPGWQEHPIELKGKAALTDHITIYQTGPGNGARIMMWDGKDEEGLQGYYTKKINEEKWNFVPDPDASENVLPTTVIDPAGEFHTSVRDYPDGEVSHYAAKYYGVNVSLLHFGKHTRESTLRFEKGNAALDMLLYRRKTAVDLFLTPTSSEYDLVMPLEAPPVPLKSALDELLGITSFDAVHVKENGDTLSIRSSLLPWPRFAFTFSTKESAC